MTKNRDLLLGVNIDHVATLRQARGTRYPEPVQAALLAEQAGADAITVHLREGEYRLTTTFALTAEDSGRPGAPIVYRAQEGEEVH